MRAIREDLREVEDQIGRIRSIPWGMIKPHDKQARANHKQSLIKLAERGGLCVTGAVAVLNDRGWMEQYPNFKIGSGISLEDYVDALKSLHLLLNNWKDKDEQKV